MDTCSSWVLCVTFPTAGFLPASKFLTPFLWFPTSPLGPVSIPLYFGSHQPAARPSLCQDHRNPGIFGGFFQGAAQGTWLRCHCTVSGAGAESRKPGESKGESPGSACKHPAWRRSKSEGIKGGLTGQGEAAKPNRSGSQTSSASQRLPVTLRIS